MSAKIECKSLSVSFGPVQAVKNVSLSVGANRITAIIGPSGCGKSTLIKSLNRLNDLVMDSRTTGEVLLDGENVLGNGFDVVELRRRVGMVFQKPNPFPKSIYDNVAYGPRIHGAKSKQELDPIVEKSLKEAALWDEVSDRLTTSALDLSGGQQQRLCIARILALEPEVLLLDNPCSGLDPISTASIEATLAELKKDYTIILVPHTVQQASRVADRAGFFLNGELIEGGPVYQIFTRPKDKRTEDYVTGKFG